MSVFLKLLSKNTIQNIANIAKTPLKTPLNAPFYPEIAYYCHNKGFAYSQLPDPLNVDLQGFPPQEGWCTRRGSNP